MELRPPSPVRIAFLGIRDAAERRAEHQLRADDAIIAGPEQKKRSLGYQGITVLRSWRTHSAPAGITGPP